MTMLVPNFDKAVVVTTMDAETLNWANLTLRLLADSSATGGALSVVRSTMAAGTDGARPHTHQRSAELFYLLDGRLEVLVGDKVVTGKSGDLIIIPPDMPHAFATPSAHGAEFLFILTPGTERFDYFRLLQRVSEGKATPQDILDTQEQFDNHFLESPTWTAHRARS